ncbi:UDP-N-acetylmuramate dehydrogenase [Desulfuromonas versatilis]|uniref:UDP-N-acetylmuramate dehydrogenase n=1 Tax=Desulfuromonas versatilis TaxID=2802975 RepID=UPI001CEDB80B|nr:UDP-N-acetylmuramate dehydrogenase [Desulfuromonas versatilis]
MTGSQERKNGYRRKLERLAGLELGDCFFDFPLARCSTWRIGGPADLLVEPRTPVQVAALVAAVRQAGIPLVVIGQGSNLLFADAGLRGVVLRLGAKLARIEVSGPRIFAEAGVWVPQLARRTMQAGLAGLEHAIGIPGTLGGLVVMNGGSHRRGIGELVRKVRVVDREGVFAVLDRQACRFGYRQSALQGTGAVVVEVELECPPGDRGAIRRQMLLDLRERRGKFPLKQPNCGSVFLSNAEMHATVGPPGRVIEEAGLKGVRIGGAEVSSRHANFIVNLGEASARDVLALIGQVRQAVRARIGYELRCEVRYVRADGEILPADQAG